jgi:YidC/Oxa1 family membrane protein insertase
LKSPSRLRPYLPLLLAGAFLAPAVAHADGGDTPRVAGRVSIVRTTDDLGQTIREEQIALDHPGGGPTYVFSSRQGTLASARLNDPHHQRDPLPPHAGAPEEKLAGGPIDLVSTWSTRWLPFSTIFGDLSAPGATVTRVLREEAAGQIAKGVLVAPATRDGLPVDRPVIAGDSLIVTAPPSVAGTYAVQAVLAGGAIKTAQAFAVADVAGVSYRVERTGEPKVLFEADPSFTRVSPEVGLPLVYVWPDPARDRSPVWIERRIEAGARPYELQLTVTVHNLSDLTVKLQPGLRISAWQHPQQGQSSMFGAPVNLARATCATVDGREARSFTELHEEAIERAEATGDATALHVHPAGTNWIANDTNYFIQAAVPLLEVPGGQCQLGVKDFAPQTPGSWVLWTTWLTSALVQLPPRAGGCLPAWLGTPMAGTLGGASCDASLGALGLSSLGAATPAAVKAAWEKAGARPETDAARAALDGRRQLSWRFVLYNGPKETGALAAASPTLSDAVEFGWMSFVGEPLHDVLVFLEDTTGSWPLAIVILTLVLKLVTWPLTDKTYRSMQKMQGMKPKLDALKVRYGNDRQRFAQEQMALMKAEGVNPLAGCLPMLLQFPIWIGLYGAILGSVHLYHEPLGLWIPDLSAADPWFVLPVLEGLLMFAQTALTPSSNAMEGGQAVFMKYGMPIMFTMFMLFLPSGLVLYIIINTGLTIVQNLLIKRRMKTA